LHSLQCESVSPRFGVEPFETTTAAAHAGQQQIPGSISSYGGSAQSLLPGDCKIQKPPPLKGFDHLLQGRLAARPIDLEI